MNKTSIDIKGIKCDREGCGYRDDSVKFKEYKKWVNKPCPKCGMNLLTRKEFLLCKFLVITIKIANKLFKDEDMGEEVKVDLNIVDKERFKEEKCK